MLQNLSGSPLKIAIVGSGISGLAAAHALHGRADITLFEEGSYFGGHTHTVDITLPTPSGPQTHGIDTGFLVFNERTYPNLIRLLAQLGVATTKSDMSFSVQVPSPKESKRALEWSGSSLNTVFAQRSNLINPRFWRMLRDLMRFNALATRLAEAGEEGTLMQPLEDFLHEHRFSIEYSDWYLLPMLGCIWSCPTDQMLKFPVATMIRFCHNHGLIQVSNRPQWWTVTGGAKHYVEKIVAKISDKRLNAPVQGISRDSRGVHIATNTGTERFDKVIIATHSDQALALLQHPRQAERAALSAITYQANTAVLHTDASVLPKRQAAWAAWNYERVASDASKSDTVSTSASVCLHYLINKLQPLPFEQPVLVSLNPAKPIAPEHVLGTFEYAHPVFDLPAIRAQASIPALQGQQNTYFCGAWMGYGFHEDGLKAGLGVAHQILAEMDKQLDWKKAA
ncbi:MAG: FAD-dependent oxidoreductase [Burkholderiaceae bacterium]|nr:FAD-dependent oxidoreductase [Burkholderiaceae bacterium]